MPPPRRLGKLEAAQQLLELGADPNARGADACARTALGWVLYSPHWSGLESSHNREWFTASPALAQLLLDHGADCLAPLLPGTACSCLGYFASSPPLADAMLAHLERQRAGGALQLDSLWQATELVLAALQRDHLPLLAYGLEGMQAHLSDSGGSPGGSSLGAGEARALCRVLLCALGWRRSDAACQLVLGSGLPIQQVSKTPHFGVVLPLLDSVGVPAEALRLLIHLGVFPAAQCLSFLLSVIDCKALEGVAAMASCRSLLPSGAAAIPHFGLNLLQLRPSSSAANPFAACKWPCPIHRALSAMVSGLI